jgi:hypothetical protein
MLNSNTRNSTEIKKCLVKLFNIMEFKHYYTRGFVTELSAEIGRLNKELKYRESLEATQKEK